MKENLNDYKKRILITGGAGFIGSHVVRHFVNKYPEYLIVNFDKLTYAGNLENLIDVQDKDNYEFFKGDICKDEEVFRALLKYNITDIIHLAAESHVDRSIDHPLEFIETNVIGTFNLLNKIKGFWGGYGEDFNKENFKNHRFHHVSTDEVYGALDMNPENKFHEDTRYNPHSPYSASKASSDHLVRAFHDTYGVNVTISNCSNNYGPNQFPEKLIPLVINCLKENRPIPVYGTGENIRDWLYVEDHARAIDVIFHDGKNGETYNIGGKHEMSNIDIIHTIIRTFARQKLKDAVMNGTSFVSPENKLDEWTKNYEENIRFVKDRAGHDLRYAIDCSKLEKELGWKPKESFATGIAKTVGWYFYNKEWCDHVVSGEYQNWVIHQYGIKYNNSIE